MVFIKEQVVPWKVKEKEAIVEVKKMSNNPIIRVKKSKLRAKAKETLSLKMAEDHAFRRKYLAVRNAEQIKKEDEQRHVIYLSNIPYGFFEGQMYAYFSQFGTVKNIRHARSPKTGRSCGWGYVEFKFAGVAKLVAHHMNGYLTLGKIMKCQVVPPERVTRRFFEGSDINNDWFPALVQNRMFIEELDRQRSKPEVRKRKERLTKAYEKKVRKLKRLGIELDLLKRTPPALKGVQKRNKKKKTAKVEAVKKEKTDEGKAMEEVEEEVKEVEEEENEDEVSEEVTEEQKEELSRAREDLATKIKASLTKEKTENGGEQMVLEVDESDDEIQFKTPPHAVKKFVKMTSASPKLKTNKSPKSPLGSIKRNIAEEAALTGSVKKRKVSATPSSENGSIESTPTSTGTPKSKKKMGSGKKKAQRTPKLSSNDTPVQVSLDFQSPVSSEAKTQTKKTPLKATNLSSEVDQIEADQMNSTTPKKNKTPKKVRSVDSVDETPKTASKKLKKTPVKERVNEDIAVTEEVAVTPKGLKTPKQSPGKLLKSASKHTPSKSLLKKTLKEATGEPLLSTPVQTPGESITKSPKQSPGKSVKKTPKQTPGKSVKKTPGKSVKKTPKQTPDEPIVETTKLALDEALLSTPKQTPGKSVKKTPKQTPGKSVKKTPKQTPGKSVKKTPKQTSKVAGAPPSPPSDTAPVLHTPKQTPSKKVVKSASVKKAASPKTPLSKMSPSARKAKLNSAKKTP